MKTICGKPISEKPISLSKAAKTLSKFISAENGASHVINAYLQRASSSFNELKKHHKQLKLPCSDRKHKRSRSKTCDDKEKIEDNYIDLAVHQFSCENPSEDAEKSSQTIVKFNQEPDEATEYDAGTEGGSGKLKKKKKKHDIKLQEQRDHGVKIEEVEADHKLSLTEVGNENKEKPTHGRLDFSQESVEREKRKKKKRHEDDYSKHVVAEVKVEEGSDKGNAGDDKEGLEEGKKHEKEKKKKDKDIMNNFSDKESVVIKPEDQIASRKDDWKEIIGNGVENRNGGSVDLKELSNKMKKRHMAGSEDKINTDEAKKVLKKRKNEDVEGRDDDDKSGKPTKKKIKKKHGGDY